MQPLSRRRRLGYLLVSCLLFLVLAPVAILYAKGYRLTDNLTITRTGGLYASVGFSGAKVYLDDVLMKETGVFQKGALIQNLKPGTYTIRVEKEGLNTWEKTLPVFRETVTDARVLMLPTEPVITEILPTKPVEKDASSTEKVKPEKNPQFEIVVDLFGPKTVASSTEEKIINKLSAEVESGVIQVLWTGEEDSRPSYFCLGRECKEEIFIRGQGSISSFYFLPGRDDVVIFETPNGIFASEIDNRSKQNAQIIWKKAGLKLRVSDNNIYIKDGKQYFAVSL